MSESGGDKAGGDKLEGRGFTSKLEEEMAYHFHEYIRLDMDGVKDAMSLGLDETILILHRFLIRGEHFGVKREEEVAAKGEGKGSWAKLTSSENRAQWELDVGDYFAIDTDKDRAVLRKTLQLPFSCA